MDRNLYYVAIAFFGMINGLLNQTALLFALIHVQILAPALLSCRGDAARSIRGGDAGVRLCLARDFLHHVWAVIRSARRFSSRWNADDHHGSHIGAQGASGAH
jgi:hypothetical protein